MQIIIFNLGEEYYAINTEKINEIVDKMDLCPVPKSPEWIEGLINLRGDIINVINPYKLLNHQGEMCYNNTIILQYKNDSIGLLVDEVTRVVEIRENDIEELEEEEKNDDSEYIIGIIESDEGIIKIIDVNTLISKNEG